MKKIVLRLIQSLQFLLVMLDSSVMTTAEFFMMLKFSADFIQEDKVISN